MAAGADPASINIFGESSLYIAAKTGSTEMVQVGNIAREYVADKM